jgi:hypothetical protein
MDIIVRIKHKLAYLQEHDDGDETDATIERQMSVHNHFPYTIGQTRTESEIVDFETEYNIRLPEDYRQFLLEVGGSGVNPGYKLYSLNEERRASPVNSDLQRPFPFQEKMDYENLQVVAQELGVYSSDPDVGYTWIEDIEPLNHGHLWVCYTGCQCWYILIVTGEARGQIWYVDLPAPFAPVVLLDGKLFHADADPLRAAQAQRVTFTQWYEAWLNKQISIAQEHWRKQGRSVPPLALDDD